jgi:allantoinase
MKQPYDLVIKNVRVVRPQGTAVHEADIAIRDGRFARIAPDIDALGAKEVYDGEGRLAFPGVVDAHMHVGIYSPLAEDAVSESRAAAQGGVTTCLTYFRTGQYYLNKGGSYRRFFPEVLKLSKGRYHVDYAYHLAPMDSGHIREIPELVAEHGVSSFKIFMFYGSHGLHGRSDAQREFLMIGPKERYDYAHFEFVMRGVQAARERFPKKAAQISLSLHCETAEIMTAYTKMVETEGRLKGLAAYHAARPPHSEGLAVFIAAYLANETALANVNLLHLSSRKALDAALQMAEVFPHIDFRREVTIGHLDARYQGEDRRARQGQPADPPARGRRVPLGEAPRGKDRLGRERPRVLPARAQGRQALPRQHLAREIGFRRDRVPAACARLRGLEARNAVQPDGAPDELEPGAPIRPECQRRYRGRARCRPRARRSGRELDRPCP